MFLDRPTYVAIRTHWELDKQCRMTESVKRRGSGGKAPGNFLRIRPLFWLGRPLLIPCLQVQKKCLPFCNKCFS